MMGASHIGIEGCHDCPLRGRPKVLGSGKSGSIAIVGEAPGTSEVAQGRPFVGKSGQLLRRTLSAAGIDPSQVYITNSCLCFPGKDTPPEKEAIEACRPRLLEELKSCQCQKVLLLGNVAVQSLLPGEQTITKCRGRATWIENLGVVGLPTYHPSLILRAPDFFPDFARDIQKFVTLQTSREGILPPDPGITHYCRNIRDVKKCVQALIQETLCVCDLETTGYDPLVDDVVLMGLRGNTYEDWHIPGSLLKNSQVVGMLRDLLECSQITWGGQNIGFDSKFLLYRFQIDWRPQIDTMLAHYCLDERSTEDDSQQRGSRNLSGVHSLKTQARERYNAPSWEETLKQHLKGKKTQNFGDADPGVLSKYLSYDTLYTFLLAQDLPREMEREGVKCVHDRILIPAAHCFRDIELTGVLLDVEYLKQVDETLRLEAEGILQKILTTASEYGMVDFNPNSPKQVGTLLYEKMGIPQREGKSTAKDILEGLQSKYPICRDILDYRQKEKLRGTYTTGLIERVSADGRIRCDFLLHGTVTGRLASANPNLQNIPSVIGPLIRDAFIATPGWELVEADYSQLELRVAGWYSRDETLIYCYNHGVDIHKQVASDIFHKPIDQITHEERYIAKYVDFGIVYGRGAPSLARGELQCSIDQAQKYIDDFLGRFQELKKWISQVQSQAVSQGYVSTPFGRKRRFPLILDTNRGEILRQAVNSPIQSMASDLCLQSLIRLHQRFDPQIARVLLTVHDSILFEVREGYRDEILPIIKYEMEQNCPVESPIPFKIELKVGQRWGSLEGVEID